MDITELAPQMPKHVSVAVCHSLIQYVVSLMPHAKLSYNYGHLNLQGCSEQTFIYCYLFILGSLVMCPKHTLPLC